uniref:Uncharacterized protein n=1 Tax=Molossus molossus TaxID=27622 RepID=A0A7J8I885_MOLMO|nr:hypothetical protein HJG59_010660 [Molossus molossus]
MQLGPGPATLPPIATRWQHSLPSGWCSWLLVSASQKHRSLDTLRQNSSPLKSVCWETFVILILGHHFPLCVFEAVSPAADHSTEWLRKGLGGGSPDTTLRGEHCFSERGRERGPIRQPVQTSVKCH